MDGDDGNEVSENLNASTIESAESKKSGSGEVLEEERAMLKSHCKLFSTNSTKVPRITFQGII